MGVGMTMRSGISKRTNKRIAPTKYDMWSYMSDRDVVYSFNFTPYKVIKKVFADMGGNEWWAKKQENNQEKQNESI